MVKRMFRLLLIMSSTLQGFPERNSEFSSLPELVKHRTYSCSVGIGSDFDGIGSTPEGLEDVSKYPALVGFPFLVPWRPSQPPLGC